MEMEHFEIVLALCRAAVVSPNAAVHNHIKRLEKALIKSGDKDQAGMLAKIEKAGTESVEIQPSRVVLSFSETQKEALTLNVKPPVDRETSTPLAQIFHPKESTGGQPIFNAQLTKNTSDLFVEWKNIDKLKAAGISPAMSLMLFGAPGTGKTMLANSIAGELNLPLVVAKLDGLVSSFLGTTARNISNLFAFANRYNCILLLDEFDALAKLRDDPNELGELKRVVNTLLQCLDLRAEHGFTIAITNHEALLDPAVWRRFDVRIEVPKPDYETRLHIVSKNVSSNLSLTAVQQAYLAWLTDGESGADIRRMVDFIKRQFALKSDALNFLDVIRAYVQLSAGTAESPNRRTAKGSIEEIAIDLWSDGKGPLNQEQLAELLKRGQATISRWIKDHRQKKG
jgi:chromosomal replication initiation ATPase DnaA